MPSKQLSERHLSSPVHVSLIIGGVGTQLINVASHEIVQSTRVHLRIEVKLVFVEDVCCSQG